MNKIYDTMKRFTLSILCCLLFYIIAIRWHTTNLEYYPKYMAILFSSCFGLIALKLYAENKHWTTSRYYIIGLLGSFVIASYLYIVQSFFNVFIFLGSGLFLLIFIAPFISKASTTLEIWWFQYNLCAQICLTIILTVILLIITLSANASIDFLFNSHILKYSPYAIWFIATIFSPIMAMSGIPNRYDVVPKDAPKIISSILGYVIIPSLLIYAVILYAYTTKILITWDLPKGGVAYLVTIFGILGITTYLASYPFHKTPGFFSFFSRNFFKIFLVPIALLAIAIGIRIYEFGITEGRYLIFLFLIWFVLCEYFYFFIKEEKLFKFIFISIILLLIIASLPRFGAESMSTWSQNQRLENILLKNKILIDGKIHKSKLLLNESNKEESFNIRSIVSYLVYNKKTNKLKLWFKEVPAARINLHPESITTKEILEDMGIFSSDSNS